MSISIARLQGATGIFLWVLWREKAEMIDRDNIIRMAREAGFNWPEVATTTIEERLERFAALVAAAEREACAKVCEARYMGDNNREDMEARRCSAAIRARSST